MGNLPPVTGISSGEVTLDDPDDKDIYAETKVRQKPYIPDEDLESLGALEYEE
jgi:hypothetical protein|nr:MAG TPA: hypothetical protein [Caudoviricetes sp.]